MAQPQPKNILVQSPFMDIIIASCIHTFCALNNQSAPESVEQSKAIFTPIYDRVYASFDGIKDNVLDAVIEALPKTKGKA